MKTQFFKLLLANMLVLISMNSAYAMLEPQANPWRLRVQLDLENAKNKSELKIWLGALSKIQENQSASCAIAKYQASLFVMRAQSFINQVDETLVKLDALIESLEGSVLQSEQAIKAAKVAFNRFCVDKKAEAEGARELIDADIVRLNEALTTQDEQKKMQMLAELKVGRLIDNALCKQESFPTKNVSSDNRKYYLAGFAAAVIGAAYWWSEHLTSWLVG